MTFENFECHLDDNCFYDEKSYSTNGSILYDIDMDTPLSDDLMEDFKWTA